jgi:hypothetical protein
MKQIIRPLFLLLLCLPCPLPLRAGDAPAKKVPEEIFQVPYRLSDVKHVVVRVKLNGKGPFNFIVDTGAPAVYVGTQVAQQVGLHVKKVGSWETFDTLEVEGGLKLSKFKARVEDPFQLIGMNKINAPGFPYHGILGYTLLAQYKIEYDFTKTHLTWTKLAWTPPAPVGLGNLSESASGNMKAMVGMSLLATSFLPKKADATYVYRGLIGFEFVEKDAELAITNVLQDTPAAQAGLQAGDVLLEFRDQPVKTAVELEKLAMTMRSDQEVDLVIQRGESKKTIRLITGRGF